MRMKVLFLLLISISPISWLNSNDVLVNTLYMHDNLLELVKKVVPDNPVIVQGGAYKAEETRKFERMWPESTIYAFEPLVEAHSDFIQGIIRPGKTRLSGNALTNKTGIAEFFICKNVSSESSLLRHP